MVNVYFTKDIGNLEPTSIEVPSRAELEAQHHSETNRKLFERFFEGEMSKCFRKHIRDDQNGTKKDVFQVENQQFSVLHHLRPRKYWWRKDKNSAPSN